MRILRDGVLPFVIICENEKDVQWLRAMARNARDHVAMHGIGPGPQEEFDQYDSFKHELDREEDRQ